VLEALPPDARAAAAAAALVALPGVLVVRAPWRAMPLVSLAFWVTSWTWLFGASRTRFLHVTLLAFTALALFRVVRPGPFPRRGWAQVMLVVAAILLAAAQARRTVPSGTDAPIDALSAQLLAWHDGWPASFEPLSPRRPFEASGLAAVTADVILLSGAPAHRALLAATAVTHVALLLALWSLISIRLPPGRAAVLAAMALLPAVAMAEASGVLAAAFAVEAVALWHDRRGHSSAFTAGACIAAGLATDTAASLGALLLAVLLCRIRSAPVGSATPASRVPGRLRTAVWTAVVLAAPLPWRVPPLRVPDAAATVFAWWGPNDVVTGNDAAAMAWIRDHTRLLDLVCAPDVPAARWIPALGARATTAPLRPGWPPPEGDCAVRISLSGRLPPGAEAGEEPSFRSGPAAVWTTYQKR
jgi:hypothetical protein